MVLRQVNIAQPSDVHAASVNLKRWEAIVLPRSER
jgi:hypothetical protein